MYDVKCTVKSVKGYCSAGYQLGDSFYLKDSVMIEAGDPKGICVYALAGMIPYLTAYCRMTPQEDWINMKKELQCPDNDNAVIFEIERIKK